MITVPGTERNLFSKHNNKDSLFSLYQTAAFFGGFGTISNYKTLIEWAAPDLLLSVQKSITYKKFPLRLNQNNFVDSTYKVNVNKNSEEIYVK